MYSAKLQSLLDRARLKPGDRISVKLAKGQYEGLLMPRSGAGDKNILVIKLDNGYNMGLSYSAKMRIGRYKHREPRAVREESEFELGKISKKLLRSDSPKGRDRLYFELSTDPLYPLSVFLYVYVAENSSLYPFTLKLCHHFFEIFCVF